HQDVGPGRYNGVFNGVAHGSPDGRGRCRRRCAGKGAGMTVIRRQALVARPPAALFALVNEVERYPKLFPWCQSVEVLEREPDSIAARLHVRAGGVGFSFATRNRLEPPELMRMQLLEGPLRRLDGEWRFTPYGDG